MTMSQRNEKTLARLKEKYDVLSRLTSEPKVMKICHGSMILFNAASFKAFNEKLNLLEV